MSAPVDAALVRSRNWKVARRQRILDELHGLPRGLGDHSAVVDHLLKLRALGFSDAAISTATGNTCPSVSYLRANGQRAAYMVHARRYLALSPQVVFLKAAPETQVPSYASVRRYQALQRLGWRQAEIESAALEATGDHAWCNMAASGARISARRHRALAAAYRTLDHEEGPSRLTAVRAKNAGHLPPAAWEDIDEPDATVCVDDAVFVDMVAVERALAGDGTIELTSTELNEAICVGLARGMTTLQIGASVGLKDDAVRARIKRGGLRKEVA